MNNTYTLATLVNGFVQPLNGTPRDMGFLQAKEIAQQLNEAYRDLIGNGSINPVMAYNMEAI